MRIREIIAWSLAVVFFALFMWKGTAPCNPELEVVEVEKPVYIEKQVPCPEVEKPVVSVKKKKAKRFVSDSPSFPIESLPVLPEGLIAIDTFYSGVDTVDTNWGITTANWVIKKDTIRDTLFIYPSLDTLAKIVAEESAKTRALPPSVPGPLEVGNQRWIAAGIGPVLEKNNVSLALSLEGGVNQWGARLTYDVRGYVTPQIIWRAWLR